VLGTTRIACVRGEAARACRSLTASSRAQRTRRRAPRTWRGGSGARAVKRGGPRHGVRGQRSAYALRPAQRAPVREATRSHARWLGPSRPPKVALSPRTCPRRRRPRARDHPPATPSSAAARSGCTIVAECRESDQHCRAGGRDADGGAAANARGHACADSGVELFAKLGVQPRGSVKDRIGIAMIEAAERRAGSSRADDDVEATSGNTGSRSRSCRGQGYELG